ncbi:MAG: PAS domain-containing protein [Desulfobacula sp.]|uniref:ATP-binding protein n=1 Tax=Desulfobacula sp. TaxID=2593537 RepID=UPI001D462FF7|nr:PAS domain-containing protein [Desulfobacula sp.]MBT3484901.1 PAS domain-containing protein [Desulfobacula sp.]MBT3803263.1 PAS domain-containing protein [Desulfobacula sp.]MBT4024646.1 PAS domain-containing protein [Desulfobacula sp.]MBT4200404.1 PAS domain-containing protein [Desulfobacula sp.]
MKEPPKDLKNWIEKELFHAAPVFIAALDKQLNIVYANDAFKAKFGDWEDKKCFKVYKGRDSVCEDCTSRFAFSKGKTSVSEQTGYDKNGKLIHYIKYTVPVFGENNIVDYLVEISTETTRFKKVEEEYKLLFDQVPCNVMIIDRDFKIVRANKQAQDMFESLKGEYCYSALKDRKEKCIECTARQTFEDGMQHTGNHAWKLADGRTLNMHVITIPLKNENGQYDLVMEMAVDISKTIKLQDSLAAAHNYLESLINTSMDGIVGISKRGRVEVFNSAARSLFNIDQGQIVSQEEITTMLPKGFLAQVSEGMGHVYLPEAELKKSNGEKFYGRLSGNKLQGHGEKIGMAFSVHDIGQMKKLEKEKIEAERMAIVGQTVAGLAHGIKNLINALDGGIYFLKSGIGKGDIKRIHKGIETLVRNIDRIRLFSKAFLNYSRFRTITPALSKPGDIVTEVVESFAAKFSENKISIKVQIDEHMALAPIDYEKIHECVTNLFGNAIDAFVDVDKDRKKKIWVKVYEEEGSIYIEVRDNGCGIDKDHKQRLFSKFFTTKGLEGTGIGLLMTKKIIQEHGGTISVLSKKGEGSIFRLRLIRGRLPKILD